MSHEEDNISFHVDLVTEALIREYLSKKKLITTLAAYNNEQPKGLHSISKRSVLQQLLGLEQAAQQEVADAKAQNNAGTTCSILELWVKHQLTQTIKPRVGLISATIIAQQGVSTSSVNSGPSAGKVQTDNDPRAAADMSRRTPGLHSSVTANSTNNSSGKKPSMSGGAAGPTAVGAIQQSAGLLGQGTGLQAATQPLQQHSAAPVASGQLQPAAHPMQQQSAFPVPKPLAAFSANQTTAPAITPQPLKQQQKQQVQQPLPGLGVPGSSSQFQRSSAAGLRAAAASKAAAVVVPSSQANRATRALEQQLQNELVLEDLDEEDLGSSSIISSDQQAAPTAVINSRINPHQTSVPSAPSRLFSGGSSTSSGGGSTHIAGLPGLQPLLPDQQRQLSVLLWGDAAARPDVAWSQGLLFSNTPGLEWGLVQLAGGPCGVLASVQAHLVATLMEQALWGAEFQPDVLLNALVHSLATIIWTARSSSTASVVMLPQATASIAARGPCDAAQVTRSAQVATAANVQQLQAHLTAAMPQYCLRKGWGLLLLLYSLLLTRGSDVIRQDMDDPSSCLVDHHGYCSMELVNLLLTGAAVSNVFDGKRQFGAIDSSTAAADAAEEGGEVLRGVTCQARVGLLTLFEWYRYVEVGQNLKCPKLPVWVVCSESHFTILALDAEQWQQTSSRKGDGVSRSMTAGYNSNIQSAAGAAVVLQFYDGMGNAECPIKLELQPAAAGGWSSKLEGVAEDRGTWQGKPIPPLECVVETKWRDVEVAWHGSDPIL